jgi:N6-adenosine-specific RNA methylase IME4
VTLPLEALAMEPDERAAVRLAGGFRVLCADPPWRFSDALGKRGAQANYPTLGLDEICTLEVPPMQEDSYLFLWRVSSMVDEAYDVVSAWGFSPKSEVVWLKRTSGGRRHFGMGRHVRAEHETAILATRGSPSPANRRIRSTFEAPVGRHSQKPEDFYDMVELLSDGPYCEMFARRARPGWACWGNEL